MFDLRHRLVCPRFIGVFTHGDSKIEVLSEGIIQSIQILLELVELLQVKLVVCACLGQEHFVPELV